MMRELHGEGDEKKLHDEDCMVRRLNEETI